MNKDTEQPLIDLKVHASTTLNDSLDKQTTESSDNQTNDDTDLKKVTEAADAKPAKKIIEDNIPLGILCLCLSGFFNSVNSIVCVYIYDWYSDIDPFLVTLTITMVTQTWYVIELNTSFKKTLWDCVENKFWGPIVFKSIFGAIASATELITLDYLPISLVEIVYNTSPVYATIISMTCIKEHVSRLDVINVVISFIGMVFITYGETSSSDQSSASQTTIAVMYVLLMLSPLFSGSGMHAVRKAKGLPAVTIYWYQNIIRISLLASYVLWIQPNPALGFTYYKNFDSLTWFLFLFMGVSLSLAQKTKSLAYRYAESSKVSGFQYIRVVIPSLYGLFIFKQPLNLGQYIGMAMIVGFNLYVLVDQMKNAKSNKK